MSKISSLSLHVVLGALTLFYMMSSVNSFASEYAEKWIDVTSEHSTFMYHHPDVSPDGKHAVYSVSPNDFDRGTVWIRSVASGEQYQLTHSDSSMDRGDVLVKWSPSGELIGFASDRGGEVHLYTVPVVGGSISRLTEQPLAASSPWNAFFSWSPDGRKIVFSDTRDAGENLYVMEIASGSVEQLTRHVGETVRDPDWSDDGESIIYVRNLGQGRKLCIYDLVARETTLLDVDRDDMSYPVWSPDGEWIAFQSVGTSFRCYIVSSQGGDAIRVGPGWAYENWGPAWDREGNNLIYHAAEVVDTPLMIKDLTASVTTSLLNTITPTGWHWASWSPQGTYLAFHQITEKATGELDTSLYIGDVASSEVKRIGRSALVDQAPKKQAPAWMPDGQGFITVTEADGETQVALIELNNSTPSVLTHSRSRKMEATVSSDGELIAFIASTGDEENIWLYDLVTDEEIQMTFSEESKFELAFSPDNSRLAFTQRNETTKFDIMSISTEGGDMQQHTRDESWELHPKWLDNQTLFYTYHRQGEPYRGAAQVNTRNGHVTHLLSDNQGHVLMPFLESSVGDMKYQRGWPSGPLVSFSIPEKATNVLIDSKIRNPLFNDGGTHVAYINALKYPKPILWRENVERIVKPARLP